MVRYRGEYANTSVGELWCQYRAPRETVGSKEEFGFGCLSSDELAEGYKRPRHVLYDFRKCDERERNEKHGHIYRQTKRLAKIFASFGFSGTLAICQYVHKYATIHGIPAGPEGAAPIHNFSA